jgi:anaerobic selenocysteine-containing dehydrogenase
VRRPTAVSVSVPAPDRYSLRLLSTRRLYDGGAAVTNSPSLAPLVRPVAACAHPADLDRLGLASGDQVRVSSPRGDLVIEVEADTTLPKGVLSIDFNLTNGASPSNVAARLIDAAAPVNDVRLETL